MAGKFEIYKDKADEFRFRLKSANGQTLLASEGYQAKASAQNGIRSVQENSADPARFARSDGASGAFRFNLTSKNGQVIGQSESYGSASARDAGIEAVARAAQGAETVDLTA